MDIYTSETILTNVRVLAIGQNVQEKNGEKVVTGATATLELDPKQANAIILAQRIGQLSLALRSMVDSNKTEQVGPVEEDGVTVTRYAAKDGTLTVTRYAISTHASVK